MRKSTVNQITPLNYDEVFELNELFADKKIIASHREHLSRILKDKSPNEIDKQVSNLIIKDNSFNLIMKNIEKNFEFNLDKDEINAIVLNIKSSPLNKKNDTNEKPISDDKIEMLAKNIIKRDLIFEKLGKLWDIYVTDTEVKNYLNGYYKSTNQPIRELLNNKEKFEKIRLSIFNEKIIRELLLRFKVRLNLKKKNNDEPKFN